MGEYKNVTIDFKGSHYPRSVILYAVFFYVRYAVSYRDLEEIMAERGVEVDHATLNRWVIKLSPLIAVEAQKRKQKTAVSWRMDETYIKVKGKWTYYYRAIDKHSKSFNGKLRDECLNEALFATLRDARQTLEEWQEDYNWRRPHSALGNLTPMEFLQRTAMDKMAA